MANFDRLKFLAEHMDTKEEVEEFENILSQFYGKKDAETLTKLLSVFNDNCPYYEVMWGLVHLAETWPKDVYVKTIMGELKNNLLKASFWMDCLISAILNEESYCSIFRTNMHIADHTSLLKLFDLMEKESPHHKEIIAELRKELENSKAP